MKDIHVHRLGDDVALAVPGASPTIYMSVDEARQLARALSAFVADVDAHSFINGKLPGSTVCLAHGGRRTPGLDHHFYLHHGRGTQGPFSTERVDGRVSPVQSRRTRNGAKPTEYVVRFYGRWVRVMESTKDPDFKLFIRDGVERIAVSKLYV